MHFHFVTCLAAFPTSGPTLPICNFLSWQSPRWGPCPPLLSCCSASHACGASLCLLTPCQDVDGELGLVPMTPCPSFCIHHIYFCVVSRLFTMFSPYPSSLPSGSLLILMLLDAQLCLLPGAIPPCRSFPRSHILAVRTWKSGQFHFLFFFLCRTSCDESGLLAATAISNK